MPSEMRFATRTDAEKFIEHYLHSAAWEGERLIVSFDRENLIAALVEGIEPPPSSPRVQGEQDDDSRMYDGAAEQRARAELMASIDAKQEQAPHAIKFADPVAPVLREALRQHREKQQQAPRVCVKCGHREGLMGLCQNHFHGDNDCGCKCVFAPDEEGTNSKREVDCDE